MKGIRAGEVVLLLTLCAVGVALGRLQTIARNRGEVDPVSRAVRAAIEPVAVPLGEKAEELSLWWHGVLDSGRLVRENEQLRQRLLALSLYESRLQLLAAENESLRRLLEAPTVTEAERIPARTVLYFPHENRMTLRLAEPKAVEPGLAVVSAGGLLGIVQTVDGSHVQVMMITQPTVRVGATVEGNPPQHGGLVRGETQNRLVLDFLNQVRPVSVGQWVLTSGLSETIPGGIPIGRVVEVQTEAEYGRFRARLVPSFLDYDVKTVWIVRPAFRKRGSDAGG